MTDRRYTTAYMYNKHNQLQPVKMNISVLRQKSVTTNKCLEI